MSGLYIHIPFCKSRCIYCGFYSTTRDELRASYVECLCKELEMRKDYLDDSLSTIYFGGGTPSQLTENEIDNIFDTIYKYYKVGDGMEITLECNPDDITKEFATFIRHSPINRVSMGAQSFSDEILRFIKRRHCASQIKAAVEELRKACISNISIDLMFGFPDESLATWLHDIDCATELDTEHISAYSLTYEDGTPLKTMLDKNIIKECDEEQYVAMYNSLIDKLEDSGYEHYEISNFAKPGFRSRHNSSYWNETPYIGIGASAHSYDRKSRQWNIDDINEYISSINSHTIPAETEFLSTDSVFDDLIMTRLRTCEGVSLDAVNERFGKEYLTFVKNEARKYIRNGCLEISGDRLRLTKKGLFVSDRIMCDLMHV